MNLGIKSREGAEMEVDRINLDDIPIAPDTDIVSMTRAMTKVRDALGISNEEAVNAMGRRLVGGVMPDLTLPQLESLAAAGNARVRVTLEVEDGRSINLALIL